MRTALIGGTTLVIAAVAISLVGTFDYRAASLRHQAEVANRTVSLISTERLIIASERASRKVRSYMLVPDERFLTEHFAARHAFEDELQRLLTHPGAADNVALLQEITRLDENVRLRWERLIELRRQNASQAELAALLTTDLQPARDELDRALRKFGEHQEGSLDDAVARSEDYVSRAFSALAVAISASILLATMFGIFLAVTLRRLARNNVELQSALAASELSRREYRALAESMPQIVWTATPDGELNYINEVLAKYIGRPAEAALGTFWNELVHPDDLPETLRAWRQSLASATPYNVEHRIRRHDGQFRWFLVRSSPLIDERGQVLKWFGTSTDVEDLKRAEEAAMSGVRLRDDFLTVASHELRTPLTSLKLQLDLMEKELRNGGPNTRALETRLEMVRRQAARLRLLNESILEASALDRGELDLRVERLRLDLAVTEVAQRYQADLARAGCQLRFDVEPVEAWFDARRLDDVLRNLLTNAAKYGLGKPVDIIVREDGGHARVSVRDAGIGMDETARARIFAKFERASPATSYGGLGLGLYISRRLVDAMRGHLTVDSAPGAGSTFSVLLPRDPPPAAFAAAAVH